MRNSARLVPDDHSRNPSFHEGGRRSRLGRQGRGEIAMPSSAVMGKFKAGRLRSSSGQKVTNPKQAVAIMLSEKRNEDKHGGHYQEGRKFKAKKAGY